jgi:hypothetical protein
MFDLSELDHFNFDTSLMYFDFMGKPFEIKMYDIKPEALCIFMHCIELCIFCRL